MIPDTTAAAIRHAILPYGSPTPAASIAQLATSLGGFIASCAAMYAATTLSYGITLALAPLAAGFLVRVFIIQHDCGHMAFFRSRRLNDVVGTLCSLATLAPYRSWRRQHAGHHRVWNNLDQRLSGADIYSSCLTTDEYRRLPARRRLAYRALRHPLVANLILPPLIFIVLYRAPFDMPRSWKQERRAVWLTNIAVAAIVVALGVVLGFGRVAAVQLPVMLIASIVGVGLFSFQHRGTGVTWRRGATWTATGAALESSTYLRLPRVLQWFTGNIGFHHIHHLMSRVPNYRLQQCHAAVAGMVEVRETSLAEAIRSLKLALWDEAGARLVTFRAARRLG
ncbi:MAG: fatty acid desaturase family protein [Gemmatimonas sp.]